MKKTKKPIKPTMLNGFLPIFKWGIKPNTTEGISGGRTIFTDLKMMLDAVHPEGKVVGYLKVSGEIPTKAQFEAQAKKVAEPLKSKSK